jgi:hypothetical protein
MRVPDVDDRVSLSHDVPELCLHRGEHGVVLCRWFAPTVAFEVEFCGPGLSPKIRAILLAEQLQLDEVAAVPGDKGDQPHN